MNTKTKNQVSAFKIEALTFKVTAGSAIDNLYYELKSFVDKAAPSVIKTLEKARNSKVADKRFAWEKTPGGDKVVDVVRQGIKRFAKQLQRLESDINRKVLQ